MKSHLDAHMSRALRGQVPSEWLQQHSRMACRVCGLCVSTHCGVHPTCRPEERRHTTEQAERASSSENSSLPSLADVHQKGLRTLKHVPKASRSLWAQALVRCLAAVVAYNT
eukprot:3671095-Karenia_brevis.AAC.1